MIYLDGLSNVGSLEIDELSGELPMFSRLPMYC